MSVLQAAYNDLALTNSRLRAEIERLRCIIGDLLWAIGHDDEQILNETTARAKAVLENKPSVVEAPEMCWHTENKP